MIISWSNQGALQQVLFDATIGETHTSVATVTEHPVETGAAITDHVRPGPNRISVEVVISNTPVTMPNSTQDSFTDGATMSLQNIPLSLPNTGQLDQPAQGSSSSTVALVGQIGSATLQQYSASFERVRRIYTALSDVQRDAIPVNVLTSLTNYDDMIIVSITVPRTVELGTAIRFTMELQQIRIVDIATVAVAAPKLVKTNLGHKAMKEEPAKEVAEAKHTAALGVLQYYGKLPP